MVEWPAEKIAKLSLEEVKSLQKNALKLGRSDIVDLCAAELVHRKLPPTKKMRSDGHAENRAGHYVSEFHFVCPNELGVTRQTDGLVRTGTWVVAAANAKAAEKFGSLVALHTAKSEPSYLQGIIKAWQKHPRESKYAEDQLVKIESGIDFLFEPTNNPKAWVGEGSGEKGYAWTPIPVQDSK